MAKKGDTAQLHNEAIRAFNIGETYRGHHLLDRLFALYEYQQQSRRVARTLEDMVRRYPSDIRLRLRLAQVYLSQGQEEAANIQQQIVSTLRAAGKTCSDSLAMVEDQLFNLSFNELMPDTA